MSIRIELVCRGCGSRREIWDPEAYRCSNADDGRDIDHVIRRRLSIEGDTQEARACFDLSEENPFVRFRSLLSGYHLAMSKGWSDGEWVAATRRLDSAISRIDGRGFRATPFAEEVHLGQALGQSRVWVKDETANVSGSHKARHFMGLMLWLEALSSPRSEAGEGPLAIASCGNAALGAAIVARAAGRSLSVFVPSSVHPGVERRLLEVGAQLVPCARSSYGEQGDPCYLCFREALRDGTLPFTCQGNENGLVIEGAQTLAWEMVGELMRTREHIDRLFVQVGGGALATACIQGWDEASCLGLVEPLPTLHAVQTQGAWPLRRAWRGCVDRLLEYPKCSDQEAAGLISRNIPTDRIRGEMDYAAEHRSEFMRPWQEEPKSIATGILDDETYDWLPIVEAMLRTGGWPVVVNDSRLQSAMELARRVTSIPADATGTAGLAGLMELREGGVCHREESVALLFTGIERGELPNVEASPAREI